MPNPIKTAIVDPDPGVVDELKSKLKSFPKLVYTAKAHTPCEAIRVIQEELPDLIFLNAEMPGKSGFDIIRMIRDKVHITPFVIFTTDYPEFSLTALRNGAIDYLKKPVDDAELKDAVERAIESIRRNNQQHKLDRLLDYISNYKQLFIPVSTGYKAVNIRDIVYVYRNPDNAKVTVVLGQSDDLVLPLNYSLNELMKILPRFDFFQIKRDVIINLKYLTEVELHTKTCRLKKGCLEVNLDISKRCLKEFKERMVI